jgi:hypothetical protein
MLSLITYTIAIFELPQSCFVFDNVSSFEIGIIANEEEEKYTRPYYLMRFIHINKNLDPFMFDLEVLMNEYEK